MFERFDEIYTKRHDYAREWKKRTGGKIMGYFCTYAPEEIMYAANILPVRILGSHEAQSISITSPLFSNASKSLSLAAYAAIICRCLASKFHRSQSFRDQGEKFLYLQLPLK